jgi:hypothetical protein
VVVSGDEEEGVATGEEEGVETGTRMRAWRLHRWCGEGVK